MKIETNEHNIDDNENIHFSVRNGNGKAACEHLKAKGICAVVKEIDNCEDVSALATLDELNEALADFTESKTVS